jgi:hypothetical protein
MYISSQPSDAGILSKIVKHHHKNCISLIQNCPKRYIWKEEGQDNFKLQQNYIFETLNYRK